MEVTKKVYICEHCGTEYESNIELDNHKGYCSKNPYLWDKAKERVGKCYLNECSYMSSKRWKLSRILNFVDKGINAGYYVVQNVDITYITTDDHRYTISSQTDMKMHTFFKEKGEIFDGKEFDKLLTKLTMDCIMEKVKA